MFNNYYVGDFENTTNGDETYIYGAGFMNINDKDATLFDNIDDAMAYLSAIPSRSCVYFHNFGNYDSWIIIDWLLNNGYECTCDRKQRKRFSGIISDDRRVYQLRICFNGRHIVEFRDTALLINKTLDRIGKDFKCATSKLVGSIDYDKPRFKGYSMTDKERQYLRNDVVLLKEIVGKILTMGDLASYLTAGGFAFNELKHSLYQDIHRHTDAEMEARRLSKFYKNDLQSTFRMIFPALPLELDKTLRKAYKGGYCINWSDGEIYEGNGVVLDVNSLYPSVMVNNPYPYGMPTHHVGTIPSCDCYIVHIEARFEVKPNCLPFIQLKNNRFFLENEYVKRVDDEVELYLSSVDYKLFHDMYNVYYEDVIESWSFNSCSTLFNNFVLKHYEAKKNATDKTTRDTAKIILNSSYGKFGTRVERYSGTPFINDKGTISLDLTKSEDMPSATYIPVAIFVTSYGRNRIIREAVKMIDKLRYIDTDSLHLVDTTLEEVSKVYDLDPKELGYFDCEAEFCSARYVRQKTYVELNTVEHGVTLDEPNLSIKACGLTEEGKGMLMNDPDIFLKFTYGLTLKGAKLMAHTVKGGKNLHRVDFNIRG